MKRSRGAKRKLAVLIANIILRAICCLQQWPREFFFMEGDLRRARVQCDKKRESEPSSFGVADRNHTISTTNSKSIVFFSAQNEIFSNVGIIHAENLFDI
jgi:hypothetical protein